MAHPHARNESRVATSSSDPVADDRRRHRRHNVALVARIHEANPPADPGVITSLSAGGAFIQSEKLASAGSRLGLEFGLAGGLGRFHGKGRVVRINRREGSEIVYGFGVEFVDPPADLVERLEELAARRREVARLDPLGYLDWPVHPASSPDRPPEHGSGMQIWARGGWADLVHAQLRPGTEGQNALTLLRLGAPVLERSEFDHGVILGYRGRILGPIAGIPRNSLLDELKPGAPRAMVWARALDVQVRLIDVLDTISWRLETLAPGHREQLDYVRRGVLDARRGVAARREAGLSSGDEPLTDVTGAASYAALDRLLAALDAMIGGLLTTLEAFSAPAIEWRPAPKPKPAPPPSYGRLNPMVWYRAASADVASWSVGRRAAALALVASIGASVGYVLYAPSTVEMVNLRETLPVDTEALRKHLPVQTVRVEGARVVVEVPASWTDLPAPDRRKALMEACWSLGAARYTEAVVRTPGNREVAHWRGGQVEVLG
ncbi:MAG: PilZ domain-containing protein [Deltaproteobacteria bacterium]|nr:PilZ domain-containing protein [Deltaproteobacteria bacterium]